MRLAISNIAWDVSEDEAVAQLLSRFSIDAIDIAPGKYFPDPQQAREKDIESVKSWWADRGIEITGMQALLFGTTGLNLFGTQKSQQAMLEHLQAVCRIGANLGANRLVFGSPKNRDCSGLSKQQAQDQAATFCRRLGDIAQACGVLICLEPNPPLYGSNFMTNSVETARVVHAVDHHAIRMQFDTGALTINKESPGTVLKESASLIAHVHASEPHLVPLGDGKTDHQLVRKALDQYLPESLVTVEMLATQKEPHLYSIERALSCAVAHYRSAPGTV